MNIYEVSKTYGIPLCILRKYESLGLCGRFEKNGGTRQYNQNDIEALSLIMTLQSAGFTDTEIKRYMQLCACEKITLDERCAMLGKKRKRILNKIHLNRSRLELIDYICDELKENKTK